MIHKSDIRIFYVLRGHGFEKTSFDPGANQNPVPVSIQGGSVACTLRAFVTKALTFSTDTGFSLVLAHDDRE
jgi:hypothetical protein